MTHGKAVRLITAWEFRRFLRFSDLFTMVLITVAFGVGIPFLIGVFTGEDEVVTLAQTGGSPVADSELFEFRQLQPAEAEAALAAEEVDGIIDASEPEAPVLTVESESGWISSLNEHLIGVALDARLAAAGVEPAEFEALVAPVDLQVQLTEPESDGPGNTTIVLIVAGLMVFIIFLGTGTLFTAITGEKTNRVTEQIVSAVSPQAWIDGKVLGTAGYILVYMVAFVVGVLLAVLINFLIAGDGIPPIPPISIGNPAVFITVIAFGLLGIALYFMLFAAVAATIDDPNTSQRSGIIMLPGMFIGLSFLGLIGDIDNLFFRIISYIPLTSPSAMPIRLLTGDAGWVEALISLLLLAVSVWIARIAAGRIFRLGILMTGKEPSWGEMLHWIRRT